MSTPITGETAWPELQRTRRAIVVVDVVESVRLMQAHEADVIDRWRRFVAEVRTEVLPKHGGRLVKSLGDGMLVEFQAVPSAAMATLDIQHRAARMNSGRAADDWLWLRAGAHVGGIVADDLDIYGDAVNMAARLAGIALAGQCVCSVEFRDELAPGVHLSVEDLGECSRCGASPSRRSTMTTRPCRCGQQPAMSCCRASPCCRSVFTAGRPLSRPWAMRFVTTSSPRFRSAASGA